MRNLIKVLKTGDEDLVLKKLKKEMKDASKNQDFERAARIRDQIFALERIREHAKVFSRLYIGVKPETKDYDRAIQDFKKILKVKKGIFRMEAYDVS